MNGKGFLLAETVVAIIILTGAASAAFFALLNASSGLRMNYEMLLATGLAEGAIESYRATAEMPALPPEAKNLPGCTLEFSADEESPGLYRVRSRVRWTHRDRKREVAFDALVPR